jgi:hypothetical protein
MSSIRRVRESLSFLPEEVAGLKFQQEGQQIKWDQSSEFCAAKEIPIDQWTTAKIQEILAERNLKGLITEAELSLYEKFVKDYA